MIDDGNTRDLKPPISSATVKDPRPGAGKLWSGIGIVTADVFASLTAAILAEDNAYTNSDAQLFGVIAFIAMIGLGALLAIIGAQDMRADRALAPIVEAVARNQAVLENLTAQVRRLDEDVDERYRNLVGITGPLPGRLNNLEERFDAFDVALKEIDRYGNGVQHGMQLRRAVLDEGWASLPPD